MAGKRKISASNAASKLVQARFKSGSNTLKECEACGFTFASTIKDSIRKHDIFHEEYIHGIKVEKTTIHKLNETSKSGQSITLSIDGIKRFVTVLVLTCGDNTAVRVANEMLQIVNKRWLNTAHELNDAIKIGDKVAFLLSAPVKQKKGASTYIVGITTLIQHPLDGLHMDLETCTVDTSKPNLKLQLGVSRIFVSKLYRRHGLAESMLDGILNHAVYGTVLNKWQIGFSQPSGAGVLMLKHWYSPSQTIPVYHET
jgi:N-acetyltransferase